MSLPTADDLDWELRAKELKRTELDRLRASAEKWRNGLSAMTGAVALVTAAGAPFVGKQLADDTAKYALGVAAGLALFFLTVASAQGMRAAFGYPTNILDTGEALRTWTANQVTSTQSALKCALICTILGLTCLASSAGIAYFGSVTPENQVTGIVQFGPDQEVCGTITVDSQDVGVTARDGTVRRFKLKAVDGIEYPKACP